MSVLGVVVGGAWVGLGVWWAARLLGANRFLASARSSRGKHEETRTRERINWRYLATALNLIVLGVLIATNWLRYDAASWYLRIAGSAVLIWLAISDLGSWRRSRQRRKTGSPTAEQPRDNKVRPIKVKAPAPD